MVGGVCVRGDDVCVCVCVCEREGMVKVCLVSLKHALSEVASSLSSNTPLLFRVKS